MTKSRAPWRQLHVSATILSVALAGAIAMPANAQSHDAFIAEASQRFAVPPALISAVMRVESANDPAAVSPVGAMGLMQIMPATWSMLTTRHGLGSKPFEARANILAGAAYLREMLDRYGELALALAAYNAGPGRVDAYRKAGRALPSETRAYVARVMGDPHLVVAAPSVEPMPDWRAGGLFVARATAIIPVPDETMMPVRPGEMASGPRTAAAVAPMLPATLFVPVASRDAP
jgi:hypothetical protein